MANSKKEEVSALLKKLDAGVQSLQTTEGWVQWLKFQSSFYSYSWNNVLLIVSQCPNASYVMGYKKWQQLGRQVSKGEKSLRILAPSFKKDKETGESVLAYFRSVPVFDISQTEGAEIPSLCQKLEGDSSQLFNALRAFSESRSVDVELEEMNDVEGYFDSVGKHIRIRASNSSAQQTKTLAHEIARSILHSSESRFEQSRADRELEAESVAYIVCQHFGLDSSDYSFGYVATWKKEQAQKALKKSAGRIASAAKKIIEGIESQSEEEIADAA